MERGVSIAGVWEQCHATLERTGWLPRGSRVVAGVSGGSDSMALLGLLARSAPLLDWDLSVVHVHHGHRGADADRDASLVQAWSAAFGLACTIQRITVAPGGGRSWEMAARDERRAALLQAAGPGGLVALAHHRDDQAETVLYRILRGTGVDGAAGMRPVAGSVVRPLLDFSRRELADWREAHGIPAHEDATNQSREAVRNRLRLELLPHLAEEYNPRVAEALVRLAQSAGELSGWARQQAAAWLSTHGEPGPGPGRLRLTGFGRLNPALMDRVLRQVAASLGFGLTEEQVRATRRGATGWPRRHQVAWDADDLWISAPTAADSGFAETPVPGPGAMPLPDGWLWVGDAAGERPPGHHLGITRIRPGAASAVRGWQPGDRIQLAGGAKKLQDLFVDHGVPRALRGWWPVVLDEGGVAAVPGLAAASRCQALPEDAAWALAWVREPAGDGGGEAPALDA